MQDAQTPHITVQTITPEDAARMLDANTGNRPPSTAHVARLAEAMKSGTYRLTGDPIRFGADGRLYDGQHRLKACVASGITIQSVVITDLDAGTLLVIDGGKKRSAADQLHIASNIDKATVDTAQMLLRLGIGNDYMKASTDDLQAIIDANPAIAEAATIYKEAAKFGLGGNIPAAELILRAHGYQDEADAWRKTWVDGEKHELTLAAHAFRERLIADPEKPRSARLPNAVRRIHLASMITRTMTHTPPGQFTKTTLHFRFIRITLDALKATLDVSTTDRPPMAATVSHPGAIASLKSQRKRRTADHRSGNNTEEPDLPLDMPKLKLEAETYEYDDATQAALQAIHGTTPQLEGQSPYRDA